MDIRGIKIVTTEDGSHSLYFPQLNETYHSLHGAITESAHVFIRNGLFFWVENNENRPVRIFEVGFGTGLNTILTIQESLQKHIQVNYTAIEAYPLSYEIITKLNYPALLVNDQQPAFETIHTAPWHIETSINNNFALLKVLGKLEEYVAVETFDVVYFDAFAPSKQPEIWSIEIIKKMYEMLSPGGVFVTYCAQGQFKRNMKEARFAVEVLQGPPGKKEMVRGVKRIEN